LFHPNHSYSALCHSYNCHRAECRGAIFGVASTLQKIVTHLRRNFERKCLRLFLTRCPDKTKTFSLVPFIFNS
jgi:hypothetical protein